jgi:hypothetical protein
MVLILIESLENQTQIYYHVYGVWLLTDFGLVNGHIGLFVTAHDYTLHFTITHTLVSTITSSLSLLGNGFHDERSPSSGFANGPRPQLPASHSNSSQHLNPSGYLTNCNWEREKRNNVGGGSERHYLGGGQETILPVLKVPIQCPLVLLV